MNKHEVKARGRHKELWNHYNKHGKITIADCQKILETKMLGAIWRTFETYELSRPPIWDMAEVKCKRWADKLNEAAKEKGVNKLTFLEMREVLKDELTISKKKPHKMIGYALAQCAKYGYSTPDLIYSERQTKRQDTENEELELTEIVLRSRRIVDIMFYPVGLLVHSYYPGPGENEITYLLR